MKKVFIIVLNYNNYIDTDLCISSLLNQYQTSSFYVEIVLVDNFSCDDSYEKLHYKYMNDVTFLRLTLNKGYACGNNEGIEYSIKNGADYICILNNDTVINCDFITPCIDELQNDKTAFVCPAILEYDSGLVQSTGGAINPYKAQVSLLNNGKTIEDLPKRIICDYVGGACMLFSADKINVLGKLPENYFLFFEETEWCFKAQKKGFLNVCITECNILHKGSSSINSVLGLHSYLMERNRVVFAKRNFSFMIFICSFIYLHVRYLKNAFFKNFSYLEYILYMWQGLFNFVDRKKFPFIYIPSIRK